jgi:hypothetical protein
MTAGFRTICESEAALIEMNARLAVHRGSKRAGSFPTASVVS